MPSYAQRSSWSPPKFADTAVAERPVGVIAQVQTLPGQSHSSLAAKAGGASKNSQLRAVKCLHRPGMCGTGARIPRDARNFLCSGDRRTTECEEGRPHREPRRSTLGPTVLLQSYARISRQNGTKSFRRDCCPSMYLFRTQYLYQLTGSRAEWSPAIPSGPCAREPLSCPVPDGGTSPAAVHARWNKR